MRSIITIAISALLMAHLSANDTLISAIELGQTKPKQTLADVVVGNPDLTTFLKALQAADLISMLQGPVHYTVLAPSNGAFAKLPPGLVDKLLKPDNKAQLRSILLHHIIQGDVTAADLKPGKAATLAGRTVDFKIVAGNWNVNNAVITQTDLKAPNGVIHIIDTVILP